MNNSQTKNIKKDQKLMDINAINEAIKGTVVGLTLTTIGHPFDTIKTCIQSFKSIPKLPLDYYRGISAPLMSNGFINSIFFYSKEKSGAFGLNSHWSQGAFAGLSASPIITFVDSIKVLQQSNSSMHQWKPWRGAIGTHLRESICMGIYFGMYNELRNNHNFHPALAGGITGISSWLFTYPIDVVKSRIQTDYSLSYKNAIKQGKLLNGIEIALVRGALVNSVGFWVYDYLNSIC